MYSNYSAICRWDERDPGGDGLLWQEQRQAQRQGKKIYQ